MYQDFYLRFTDEAAAAAVLYTKVPVKWAETTAPDEAPEPVEWETRPNYRNIDVLGTLYEKTPDPLPEGYVPVPIAGWHVNVRALPDEDAAALEPFKVNPEPMVWRRVWG